MTHGYMCPKLMDQHKPSASLKHCEILFLHCFCNSIAWFSSVNSGDDIMPSCQKVGWDWYPAVICLQKYLARSMYNLAVFLNILLTQSQTVTFFLLSPLRFHGIQALQSSLLPLMSPPFQYPLLLDAPQYTEPIPIPGWENAQDLRILLINVSTELLRDIPTIGRWSLVSKVSSCQQRLPIKHSSCPRHVSIDVLQQGVLPR